MAIQIRRQNIGSRPQLDRTPDAGVLLSLARHRRAMSQDEVAERGGYRSRHTVMRWEQGKLPVKSTPVARRRWIRIMGCYGLHRSEADQIFEVLNMRTLLDEEWQQLEAHFLPVNPDRFSQDVMSANGANGHRLLSEETYELGRLVYDANAREKFQLLIGSCGLHIVSGDLFAAEPVANELMAISIRMGDPTALLDSCASLGMVLFHMGKLAQTRLYLEKGIEIFRRNPEALRESMVLIARPEIMCFAHLSHTLWFMGYPEQAIYAVRQALHLTRETDAPHIGRILFYAAALYHLLRDAQSTIEYARSAMSLIGEVGDTHWIEKSRIMMGWAMSQEGEMDAGIEAMLQGLEGLRENRLDAGLAHSRYLTMLAEAYVTAGRIDKAAEAVARAWSRLETNGEYLWDPDLCMVEGEILYQTGDEEEAEAKFRRALNVARRQGARMMELRAATRLASQLYRAGQREQARATLSEAYGWFTEGFDAHDLKDASSLLQALGSNRHF